MILTEILFRKIVGFAAVKETQFHTDCMAQASAVLKQAHKRGVELEYILEVRLPKSVSFSLQNGTTWVPSFGVVGFCLYSVCDTL
jgi:hypothetical protein